MADAEKKSDKAKKITGGKVTNNNSASYVGIITLIFFTIITTIGGMYLLWENQDLNAVNQLVETQRIDLEISSLKQQQLELAEQNKEQIKNIISFQENLRRNLTNLIRNNKHLRNDWLMAEAEYLIQLANLRILLEKDVATAAVALKSADARLAQVADPALLNVRKILAQDLQLLNNIPVIDLAGLSVTLSAMSNNIPNLPLRTPDPKSHKIKQPEKNKSTTEISNLNELPATIWKDIKNLIIIRKHKTPIMPLLAPEQHFFLVQNLALLLEQTRLSLLNGHNEIYHERLTTTAKWISQYFDTEHNITRNMLANIKELHKVDIDPTLPDISSTYSAVNKYRTQGIIPKVRSIKIKKKEDEQTKKSKKVEDNTKQ